MVDPSEVLKVYDPNKDYTHTAESQQAFDNAVAGLRTGLRSEVFTKSTTFAEAPTREALTLKQVRQMFFVGQLTDLSHATLWQSDKTMVTKPEDSQPADDDMQLHARVGFGGTVDVEATVPDSQNSLPFTNAQLARGHGLFGGNVVYEMLLSKPNPSDPDHPLALRGRYVQGLIRDRVELRYPDGSMVRKGFMHGFSPRDSAVPPQPSQANS